MAKAKHWPGRFEGGHPIADRHGEAEDHADHNEGQHHRAELTGMSQFGPD